MPEEVVPDDRLENNIVKCFSLLHKTQYILGSTRVTIKDRAVVLPSGWLNLYSFILVQCALFSEVYLQKFYFDAFYHRNTVMYYACLLGTLSEYITYIACLFVARFTKREENVKIYSKIQKIDRILQLTRDSYYTDFQARVQNRTMVLICVFFPLGFSIHSVSLMDKPIYTALLAPGLLTIYIDFLLLGSFLYFIAVRLSIFNKMMMNHINKYEHEELKQKLPKTVGQRLLSLVHPSYGRIGNTLELNRWSECIQEILKTYQMVIDIFNFQVFILAVTVLLWTFIAIGAMIVGLRSGLYPLVSTVAIGAWAVFYYVLLTVAAILNDWFLYQMKATKMLCVRVMSYNYDDPYQKAACNILRIIHYTKPKFVVYGVFELTISLPLTLMGIIASNVLVVVQFIVSRD